ncbi:hypothetical protein DOT_6114 [Desulfosporosinus sp. OT]|nr:hypothetical protein DOT_6114 [Desulfosporosinus sp. OT]
MVEAKRTYSNPRYHSFFKFFIPLRLLGIWVLFNQLVAPF